MNGKINISLGVLCFACLLAAASCATTVAESTKDIEERLLASHVKVVHKDTLQKTESGLYYSILKKGTGTLVTDTSRIFVKETTYDMDYNITGSTEESVARQLGTFSYSNHYAPVMMQLGTYSNMVGLEEMLKVMRIGEKRKIWLPYWLSNYYEDGNTENTSTLIYDVEVVDIVNDIEAYELNALETFRDSHYPGLDTLEKGMYFKTIKPSTGDTIAYGTTVHVRYIGKFLDGFVFDTNVADSALKYSIYDSSSEYEVMDVALPSSAAFFSGTEDADETVTAVHGFLKCILNMRYGETAICFFNSALGYSSTGESASSTTSSFINGGYSIPPYSPLFFWIYVTPETD